MIASDEAACSLSTWGLLSRSHDSLRRPKVFLSQTLGRCLLTMVSRSQLSGRAAQVHFHKENGKIPVSSQFSLMPDHNPQVPIRAEDEHLH